MPLDTWAIIVALATVVAALGKAIQLQYKERLTDKDTQITRLQTERDVLITKNEQMQEMIWTQTRTADVAAQAMEEAQPPKKARR